MRNYVQDKCFSENNTIIKIRQVTLEKIMRLETLDKSSLSIFSLLSMCISLLL